MNLQQLRDKIAIFDFQFRKDLQTTIPKIIANKAVFLFKKNFQDESFFGARWKEVNRLIPQCQFIDAPLEIRDFTQKTITDYSYKDPNHRPEASAQGVNNHAKYHQFLNSTIKHLS